MHLKKWMEESKGRPVKHEESSHVFFPVDPTALNFNLTAAIRYLLSRLLQIFRCCHCSWYSLGCNQDHVSCLPPFISSL